MSDFSSSWLDEKLYEQQSCRNLIDSLIKTRNQLYDLVSVQDYPSKDEMISNIEVITKKIDQLELAYKNRYLDVLDFSKKKLG